MDTARHDLVRGWLIKARRHFETAHQIASLEGGHLDVAVFHCHQAAEKTLKGFLIFHGHPVDSCDDLVRLVALAVHYEPGFAQWTEAAHTLNPCGGSSGNSSPSLRNPSRNEFCEALAAARQFVTFIPLLLPRDVHA